MHQVKSQKLEFLTQNINSKGHFTISTYSEESYDEMIKDSIRLITPTENKDSINLDNLAKIFPDKIEGNCYINNHPVFAPHKLKICNEAVNKFSDEEYIYVKGTVQLRYIYDQFYVLRIDYHESGGFYILDSETGKSHLVFSPPRFTSDKKFILSEYTDYHSYSVKIIDLAEDRELDYILHAGRFRLNNLKLVQREGAKFKTLFLDLTQTIEFDHNYKPIEPFSRQIKLRIQ